MNWNPYSQNLNVFFDDFFWGGVLLRSNKVLTISIKATQFLTTTKDAFMACSPNRNHDQAIPGKYFPEFQDVTLTDH